MDPKNREEKAVLREEELLQYVCKGADMGREGIHAVLGYVHDEELKRTLRGQEEVYRTIREEARGELRARGKVPQGVGAMARASAEVMSAGKLLMDRSGSRIAEMTIQGHNMGVSKTLQHLHDYHGDGPARDLAQRLMAAGEAGVEELKPFL